MQTTILATKLYVPPPQPKIVLRPRLIDRLNESLQRKLTLISAPAGFGKTTLVSGWVAQCSWPAAWLSLDENDSAPARFLAYLVAALQRVAPHQTPEAGFGEGVLAALHSPQPPPVETLLTGLINEIAAFPEPFLLVLDDYHLIEARPSDSAAAIDVVNPIDGALAYLIEHLPPRMHLVIATREDPPLPLARYRARGQLTELRAADLRFTPSEASEFLTQVMGLRLPPENIAALEARTEGWIAGLQLASLALQGLAHPGNESAEETAAFIQSFTGSHHYIMDYLMEEVLRQQPESVQSFLLRTSILNRLCGPLCDAVCARGADCISGQSTLEYLERANLFIVPLDHERRWYRYHHLFTDLLRQRLGLALSKAEGASDLAQLHLRASRWYEDNGFALEAFQHAAAAGDVDRAARLIDEKDIPLHFGSPVNILLNWLDTLSKPVLDARPSLWWRHASLLLIAGRTDGVEEKLQSAEAALSANGPGRLMPEENKRNLIGQIAAARATLALTRYDIEGMLIQSRRALEYLDPTSLFTRASACWTLGFALMLQGDRAAARQAWLESIALSKRYGAVFTLILATVGLGNVQEGDLQLHEAAETYQQVLILAGDQPQQIIHEVHLGLARILYEWNDLDAAEQHAQQSFHLARRYDTRVIDRFILCEIFLAHLKLAQGDTTGAEAFLAQAEEAAHQPIFAHRLPEAAAERVQQLLHQGRLEAAAQLAHTYPLPLSQARVHLAQGDPSAALALLAPFSDQALDRGWQDERLKGLVLQSLALQASGAADRAAQVLRLALAMAEPGGSIRVFVDEGQPMMRLISQVVGQGLAGSPSPQYARKLLEAFEAEAQRHESRSVSPPAQLIGGPESHLEALSQRELEVLRLIAQGLSNQAISEKLFLAIDTVKGHNRRIFEKLQVQNRTEAVARARELGLL